MDITYFKIFFAVAASMVGWIVTHHFNAYRDHQNKKREMQLSYLIEAYMSIEDVCNRHGPDLTTRFKKLESSLSSVQLFGTESQIKMASSIALKIAKMENTEITPLLKDLRKELRKELKLQETNLNIVHFRYGHLPPEAVKVEKVLQTNN